jgi:hypothetical protein
MEVEVTVKKKGRSLWIDLPKELIEAEHIRENVPIVINFKEKMK